jgi:drug/metabolite transporter (DMT)-like permease
MLRSGDIVEIGPARDRMKAHTPRRWTVVLGFASLYLIWGSTYLGIRYAVESIPPLLMMAIRHSTAGAFVYLWARYRGEPSPTRKQWGYAVVAGAMLFLFGHGTLAWAEQKIPSGLAALMCATLPLWTVLLGRLRGTEKHLGLKAWTGVLLGFAGVGVLIGPGALAPGSNFSVLAAIAAMLSSFAWAVGTLYSKAVPLPKSSLLSASMQMLTGGAWLLLSAAVSGEIAHVQISAVTITSVLALLYLIVFGSIIAFTVFMWLLTVASPSRVSTYAYVNPVVAVLLGWALAGEAIGWRTAVATAIIVVAVVLVTMKKASAAPRVEILEEKLASKLAHRSPAADIQ